MSSATRSALQRPPLISRLAKTNYHLADFSPQHPVRQRRAHYSVFHEPRLLTVPCARHHQRSRSVGKPLGQGKLVYKAIHSAVILLRMTALILRELLLARGIKFALA
eukprot:gene4918-9809_t